jgi:hypothetical protein
MIFNSLTLEQSIYGDPPGKVGRKLLESLISIVSIVEVTVIKQMKPSSMFPTPPIDLSEVYLSSRLLPLLSSLLMKPLQDSSSSSEEPSYLSLEPNLKSR